MKNKFDFYEVVIVKTNLPKLKSINACKALIIGMAMDDEGKWTYAIQVFVKGDDLIDTIGWDVYEDVLQPTGKFMKREDFYDGSTAKVVVDDKGHGHLKELHLKKPTDKYRDV